MEDIIHEKLRCGIECGVVPLPRRHVVAMQIRILSGVCQEPADKLGLARLIGETIDKGTQQRTGRELSDAFDAIGASYGGSAGRETTTFTCTVLPEHFEKAVSLHAEFLRTPTFPQEAVEVGIELAKQELTALEDDAQALADKMIGQKAYGEVLGRHPLGEEKTLDTIARADLENHWRSQFGCGRMQVVVAGPIDPKRVAAVFEENFAGFGQAEAAGRETFPVEFTPGTTHRHKELEQQQIGICWPGVDAKHDDFAVQKVMLGILSGGMSCRLFTEVREKQGLVYWVNAWQETPRGTGMIFMGASTTPQRCDQTYTTLLREVDRLAEDLTEEELDRAVTGILTRRDTRGAGTKARCAELADDLFFFGRPRSKTEKTECIKAVTVADVCRYLNTYPRDRLCVVTLGPRALEGQSHPACLSSVKE